MITRGGTIRPGRIRREAVSHGVAALIVSLTVAIGISAAEQPANPGPVARPSIEVKILPNGRVVVPNVFEPPAVRGRGADNGNENIRSRLTLYANNYRPFLQTEYAFLRKVCEPTEAERKRLARNAERAFQDAIVTYEALQRNPQPRRPGESYATPLDPRRLIREGLLRVVETHLSAGQAARYRDELEERTRDRKLMAIQCIVAKLDKELLLSAEQRVQIACSLYSGWDDTWLPSESLMLNADRYCARIPRERFYAFLDDIQRTNWDEAMREQVSSSLIQPPALTFPEDDDLVEARERRSPYREDAP